MVFGVIFIWEMSWLIRSIFDGIEIWVSRSVFCIPGGVKVIVWFVVVRENEEFGVSKSNELDEVVENLRPVSLAVKHGEEASIGLSKVGFDEWIGVNEVVCLGLGESLGSLRISLMGDGIVGVGVEWWITSCSVGWVNQLVPSRLIALPPWESLSDSMRTIACRSIGIGCDLFEMKQANKRKTVLRKRTRLVSVDWYLISER